jgi:hypothetical protein
MKIKIICIFITMLLFSTAICSLAVNVEKNGKNSLGWSEKQKLLASDGAGNNRFGNSVEINGNDAIVGSYFDDISGQTDAGSAYVFVYNGATWTQQQKLTASDLQANDEFGWSVSIDGDYAIVGAHKEDGFGADRGAAYVFYRSGSTWSEQQKLTPGDAADYDYFGKSVAIDDEYAIIGAPGKNSDQGFSYVFKRTGTTWTQMTKIGATPSNKLGWSVSISMPFVIMGAYGTNSNTGAAHIYELIGSSWYGKGALTASDGNLADLFGISVAIDDDYVICGSPGHDLTSGAEGAAYIFEKPTSGWTSMTETQKIIASDNQDGDGFGQSVSVDGDGIIVSSPSEDGYGNNRGAAYIFYRSGSSWSEQQKLTPSDAGDSDYFGWGVSISSNTAISGAYTDDNTNGADAGSAYIFDYENKSPTAPVITGPTSGKPDISYNFNFSATDPDGDYVRFIIDWGDTNSETTSFVVSGSDKSVSHSWSKKDTYTITARAEDTFGNIGPQTTKQITIPRTRTTYNLWYHWFLERFPLLERLIGLIRII